MSANPQRPAALPPEGGYIDSSPFWQGTREGKLMLQYCLDASRFQHPPGPVSIYTGSRRLTWKPVSGLGHVYAFTTLRAKGLGADGRLPYRLALVELAEGVRILANLRGPENADWRIGDAVLLAWEQLAEGRQYPIFVRHETHADSATARARIDA